MRKIKLKKIREGHIFRGYDGICYYDPNNSGKSIGKKI